jgi:succinylglutamic semialdehyde dehydrogenase
VGDPFLGNFIDGRFMKPSKKFERFLSEDPGDLDRPVGEVVYTVASARAAVESARKAFPSWSSLSMDARARHLKAFQKALARQAGSAALLITREMGKPLEESRVEVQRVLSKVDIACVEEAKLLSPGDRGVSNGLKARLSYRPRGVIAVLSPFNVPLHLAVSPAISAMLAGNTVVLKPSEITPFVGQMIALCWKKAGLPPGVFNLAQGKGDAGAALVEHPQVDGVLFTGSWRTGSSIQKKLLSQPGKMCALEMGGKNAAIVLKDCDLDLAVNECVKGAFMTTGQRCNATSRILVEKKIADAFVDRFLKKTDALHAGYGTEAGVFMGPLSSERGLKHVESMLAKAGREGFKVLRPGGKFEYPRRGYYLKPSAHIRSGAPSFSLKDGSYADEEILGPDAAIYLVDNLDEAIALNNRSRYGLVTSIFTRSYSAQKKALREAQTGLVNINASTVNSSSLLPFGGLKRSGNNRPAGFFTGLLCALPTSVLSREGT